MAWYPGGTRMELQPESDAQPAIRPTQLIVHSIVAPWDEKRLYAYWRDSTSLESHFGLDYDGSMGQYIGTETRADANAAANRRPDGTGAISVETASNTKASDPWTPEQVAEIVDLGVWAHHRHGIPLRICRTHDDPGFGYHRLHAAWSTDGTSCPGDARVRQFRDIVFPAIVARATGTNEEDDMPTADEIAKAVLTKDGVIQAPWGTADNQTWALSSVLTHVTKSMLRTEAAVGGLTGVVAKLAEGGGLTAAEIQAAAQAGAQAALDRLGDALTEGN